MLFPWKTFRLEGTDLTTTPGCIVSSVCVCVWGGGGGGGRMVTTRYRNAQVPAQSGTRRLNTLTLLQAS